MRPRASLVQVTAGVAAVVIGLIPAVLRAADPPHWSGQLVTIGCDTGCHVPHSSLGGSLTGVSGNANLCQSCHVSGGSAGDVAINTSDKASLAAHSGVHHAWDVPVANAAVGSSSPLDVAMQKRLDNGNVVCSTCHDQHASSSAKGGDSRVGHARRVTNLGSTGALSSGGAFSGTGGFWYLIEVVSAGTQSTAVFRYSKDNGTSWFPNQAAGASVALDSGVTVSFGAGNYAAGERWEFSASWPFLRNALDSGDNAAGVKFCRDCHRDWAMDQTAVETGDGALKAHPVGVMLGANGRGYDRAAPLDANGAAQGTDGNVSNDLRLGSDGTVQCFTCHGVHYADGNSLTEDHR